jgi:hypothetical protein
MPWARTGHTYLAYALGLLVVVQFFLAGYGLSELGNHGMGTHKDVGHIMEPVALILVVFAVLGRYRGALLGMSIVILVLIILQSVWIDANGSVLRALHVLGALAIAMTVREVVAQAREPVT